MDQLLNVYKGNSWNVIRRVGWGRFCSMPAIGCLLMALVVFNTSCGKAPVKPSEIAADDICFGCKAPITAQDIAYAAEFVTSNGFVRKFDDFACLIANAKKVGRKNIVAIYAVDAGTHKLCPIEEVQLVRSDKFASPKKGGILAFKDPAQAEKAVSQYKAEKINLDDLLK